MRGTLGLLMIFVALARTSAQNINENISPNYIFTAVPFLQIPGEGRGLGMGAVGAATSADAYSINWNTSKLAFTDKKTEIGTSLSNWLPGSGNGTNYLNACGYTTIDELHALSASMTHFGIVSSSNPYGNFNLREFEFTMGYSFQLAKRFGIGINLKGVHSNLPKNIISLTDHKKPEQWALAGDISFMYENRDMSLKKWPAQLSIGVNISDVGSKLNYTNGHSALFLPTNLKLGAAYELQLKKYRRFCFALDFNKLLVPTPPIYDGNGEIISGIDPNTGIMNGIIQSFYDAPGIIIEDNNGIESVQKNSRLKEELNEISVGGGLEFYTNQWFLVRAGYFYEHKSKGPKQYFTTGFGVKIKDIAGIDFAYLIQTTENILLEPDIRLSMYFTLD